MEVFKVAMVHEKKNRECSCSGAQEWKKSGHDIPNFLH